MKRKVILTIGLLMLVTGSWTQAQNPTEANYQGFFLKNQNAPDPGIPDTVKVQSKDVPLGATSFSLQVSLYNDEELSSLNLPIRWDSPDIICDSVSFIGTRISYVGTKLFSIDNVNQRLQAGMIIFFEQYLQPGSGLVYTAYFTVKPGTSDQLIDFDSTFYPPGGLFALTLTNGLNMFPQFVHGTVKYGNPPTDPIILLEPPSIGFNAVQGGTNPTPQTVSITNVGAGTLNWTATKKSAWLTLNPASGTGNATVTLSVSIASLIVGTYYDTITVADPAATNTPQKVPVTLTVAEPPPVIVLSPSAFTYGVFQGGTLPDDTLSISNGGGGVLNWTMTKTSAWLALIPTSGSGNADVTLRFDVSSLVPGIYRDTIVVTAPGATNSPRRVIVTLVIQQPPPRIVVDPTSFSYTITEGGSLPDDQLSITNGGGGTLTWTVTKKSSWLSLNPAGGTGNATVTLSFAVSSLPAAIYYDTITVSATGASNTPQKVPVMLTVNPPPPTIVFDPAAFSYNIVQGGAIVDDQLSISNGGGGTLNWTASKKSGWLTLNPTSGSGDAVVILSFNVAALPAGTYYDTITVAAPGATNTPQKAPVTLVVQAVPVPIISVSPPQFLFDATQGGANPSNQALTITNTGQGTLNWTVAKTKSWLGLNPTSGSGNGTVAVSADIAGLAPGNYYDTITVSDPAAGNSPVRVPVRLHIEALPVIVFDPISFNYTITEGGSLADDHLAIGNGGGGTMTWTVGNLTSWLALDPTSGSDDGLVTLSFTVSGLPAGVYHDIITIAAPAATNSPQLLPVTLTVNVPPPVISLEPHAISVSAVEGAVVPDTQVTVTNTGGGTLHWTAANKTSWITLDPTSGTGDGVISLSFDIAGLAPGIFYDTVSVSDPAAGNSPQKTIVTLTITEAPPDADTVYVETVAAIPGEQVMVGVSYVNFTTTRDFTLPLTFDPAPVDCDSVSFVGTRIVIPDESLVAIDNVNGTIVIHCMTMGGPILEPGSGLIAKLFFTVDPGAAAQMVPIDTIFVLPTGQFNFTDYDGAAKKTEFFAGGIDISTTPCFEFPTDTVAFIMDIGGIVPSISFPVTNPCGGILEWTVSAEDDWAVITPTSGTQDDQVTFTVDTTGLAPGSYVTTATFESNGTGTPYTVVITLNLRARPIIHVSPSIINFGSVCQGDQVQSSFTITNTGAGVLEWHADDPALLNVSPTSGTAPSVVTFLINTGDLDYGFHTFDIKIMSDNAVNSPQVVTVKLFVINCEGCSFDIAEVDGPQGHPVAVPVYAFGIVNAAGVQFNIAYDAGVLVADSITSAYMAGPTIGFSGSQIHYVWDDISDPITVPDGEPIMTLWFTVVGEIGEVSCLTWTGTNEVADPNGIPLPDLTYCSGCVTVVQPYFELSGRIIYYDLSRATPGITVDLSGDAIATTVSGDLGEYGFVDLTPGHYTITPSRYDDDPGVSVADAIKIRRHLAFVEPFTSPYKMIAADVNLSKTVSISDVILIRRYLAELDPLPSGNWTFVATDYAITMSNWFDAPHDIDVAVMHNDVDMLDFVAVRMGDVNNTWSEPKAAGDFMVDGSGIELTIPDLSGAPSDDVAVPVLVANFTAVAGVEIHITFDQTKITVDSITSARLADPTVNAVNGRAHLIWEDFLHPVTLDDGDTLMFIYFHVMPTATGDIPLAFMATCELVDEIGDPYPLILTGGKVIVTPTDVDDDSGRLPTEFGLKQNYPNPFNPSTTISYTVDRATSLMFEVFNVSGQVVDRIDLGHQSPGAYSFVYAAGTLPSGIYTYRLTGDGLSVAKQMILVK